MEYKYSNIIGLQDYFYPVFNLQDETEGYWKQFIPTNQFDNLLKKTLDAVSGDGKNRRGIWVKGTFGTGKSHASSVIKHLLCDKLDDIEDYIQDRIESADLKNRLLAFRDQKRFFPIVLKDIEGVHDIRTFSLTLERRIKQELKKEKHNITVDSDFERAIKYIDETAIDIDKLIQEEPELRAICKTEKDIIKHLKANDMELYMILEKSLAKPKYSVQLGSENITDWLKQIEAELKKQNIADGLIILWDEFTALPAIDGILNMAQKIAELSEKHDIFLYLINHKNIVGNRELDKAKDRFHEVDYKMETITTYHIMAASIRKLNEKDYMAFRGLAMEKYGTFDKLIPYLTQHAPQQSRNDMLELYPLHPYSAFLCSSIADHIGSANRSVMRFMYDEEKGFKAFLNNYNYNDYSLLTADMLWDYFLDEFLNDNSNKYTTIVNTFNTHKNTVKGFGQEYEKVFKGVLLLNAMKNTFDGDQVLPCQSNIVSLFEGVEFATEINEILESFNQNQIIQRDPNNIFLISLSSLPIEEINKEIDRQESKYQKASDIFEYSPEFKNDISNMLDQELIRQSEFIYLSCSEDESRIRSRINHGFKDTYKLPLILFMGSNNEEVNQIKTICKELASSEFENKIFIVFDEIFDNDGNQRTQFIKYEASRIVAQRHTSSDTEKTNSENANTIVKNWVNRIKRGNYTLFFNKEVFLGNSSQLARSLNMEIGYRIFSKGIESLPIMRTKSLTFFNQVISRASSDALLISINRDDAESRLRGQLAPARLLFKNNDDYIVDENLNLKSDAPKNHPLVMVQKKVDNIFSQLQSSNTATFNLGHVLSDLTKSPFGFYSNIPNTSLLSFAMRKYINELYHSDIGTPINSNQMAEKVVAIFTYWNSRRGENTLRVRFGSKEEKDLKDLLIKVFELKNYSAKLGQDSLELTSIKNVRWAIAEYFLKNTMKNPLWVLKYIINISDDLKTLVEKLNNLIQSQDENTKTDEFKDVLKMLKENYLEFFKLLQNKKHFDSGFNNFVFQKTETFKVTWFDDFIDYLDQNLQPEIAYWTEDDIEKAVLRFCTQKLQPKEYIYKPNDHFENQEQKDEIEEPDVYRVINVKKRISNTTLENFGWQLLLKNLIDEYPQVIDFVDKQLG